MVWGLTPARALCSSSTEYTASLLAGSWQCAALIGTVVFLRSGGSFGARHDYGEALRHDGLAHLCGHLILAKRQELLDRSVEVCQFGAMVFQVRQHLDPEARFLVHGPEIILQLLAYRLHFHVGWPLSGKAFHH